MKRGARIHYPATMPGASRPKGRRGGGAAGRAREVPPAPVPSSALDLAGIQALVATVESGSVLAASRVLGTARSTLRRQIAELERHVGAPLLSKKDGKVVPSKAGRVALERGKALLSGSAALMREAREAGSHLGRRIQIAVPAGLPRSVLLQCREMQTRFSEPVTLRISEDPVRLLDDGVDIAIHVGKSPPEGPWVSVALVPMRRVLMTSAEYIREHGLPASVAELADHTLLCWHTAGLPPPFSLPLRDGGSVAIDPQIVCNDESLVRGVMLQGGGIAFLPDADIPIPEREGSIGVLTDTVGDDIALHAVVPKELSEMTHPSGIVAVVRAGLSALRDRPG